MFEPCGLLSMRALYGMLIGSAFLFGVLVYPMVSHFNLRIAYWWIQRRSKRETRAYQRRCAARLKEVL